MDANRRESEFSMKTKAVLFALCAVLGASCCPAADANAKHLLYVAAPGIRNYLEYGGHGLPEIFDCDGGKMIGQEFGSKGAVIPCRGAINGFKAVAPTLPSAG